jgi:hypothetical protein
MFVLIYLSVLLYASCEQFALSSTFAMIKFITAGVIFNLRPSHHATSIEQATTTRTGRDSSIDISR